MKIKTKLNLGVGLLFLMIIILSLVAAFYIFSIKELIKSKSKQNGENRYYIVVYKVVVQSWKTVYFSFWA